MFRKVKFVGKTYPKYVLKDEQYTLVLIIMFLIILFLGIVRQPKQPIHIIFKRRNI